MSFTSCAWVGDDTMVLLPSDNGGTEGELACGTFFFFFLPCLDLMGLWGGVEEGDPETEAALDLARAAAATAVDERSTPLLALTSFVHPSLLFKSC